MLDFAGVWTNNIYSFLGRHVKSGIGISLPLQRSMLYAAWEMVFVISLDQQFCRPKQSQEKK